MYMFPTTGFKNLRLAQEFHAVEVHDPVILADIGGPVYCVYRAGRRNPRKVESIEALFELAQK
ncbi:hypothetical protein B0H19DRAFT_1267738 [Mycena capillaripes]|nr:hypothetical protein B0H19DRAFT_1267738 [Mycena capillaripes]